jgi:hypothetical protein
MPHTPYHFYVHAHLPAWRLVRNGAEAWPLDAVAEDWVFTRARAGADTNADVRAMVDAQGYCLFRLGGTFEDVAAELAALTQSD